MVVPTCLVLWFVVHNFVVAIVVSVDGVACGALVTLVCNFNVDNLGIVRLFHDIDILLTLTFC